MGISFAGLFLLGLQFLHRQNGQKSGNPPSSRALNSANTWHTQSQFKRGIGLAPFLRVRGVWLGEEKLPASRHTASRGRQPHLILANLAPAQHRISQILGPGHQRPPGGQAWQGLWHSCLWRETEARSHGFSAWVQMLFWPPMSLSGPSLKPYAPPGQDVLRIK